MRPAQRSDRLRVIHVMKQTSYFLTSHDKVLKLIIGASGARELKEEYDLRMMGIQKAKEEETMSQQAYDAALKAGNSCLFY